MKDEDLQGLSFEDALLKLETLSANLKADGLSLMTPSRLMNRPLNSNSSANRNFRRPS